MQREIIMAAAISVAGCGGGSPRSTSPPLRAVAANELRAPADFAVIGDRAQRSRALFVEASRVLMHPRCANCHPVGDEPRHDMTMVPHEPPVVRGSYDAGVAGMECQTCHQDRNQQLARVPGAPDWRLAPIELGWVGKSAVEICHLLTDPQRNGRRSLARIVAGGSRDQLIGWGWHPGDDREPAPGTQQQFGALLSAWVETGAACPEESQR